MSLLCPRNSMRNTFRAGALAIFAVVCATLAQAAPADNLLKDSGFDALSGKGGPWEVRYGLKESQRETRPRWRAVSETDAESPEHGKHLYLKPFGRAAGTVYIGQRVALPKTPRLLDLTVDYQTFCPQANRSGQLAFFIMSAKRWDGIEKDPEKVTKLVMSDLLDVIFHPNKKDVTEWRSAVCDAAALGEALEKYAGAEAVVGVSFVAWHDGSKEWMRLDNLRFGAPGPRVAASSWPAYAYRGDSLTLFMIASVPEGGAVTLRYKPDGGDKWRSVAAKDVGPGRYSAEVPAEATSKPLQVRAVLTMPGKEEMTTAMHKIEMTERPVHPNVMVTKAELAAMREKIKKYDWAKKAWEDKKRAADEAMKKTDQTPPAKGGGWSHDYTCPEDGARLKFREDKPHAHLCPVCGKEWTDAKRDATWCSNMHHRFGVRANSCALAYQITGDETYAREAIRILTWYADHYAGFPLGKGPAGRGKVHSQSLTEASWLTGIIDAADMAYPAMTPEEARHIETDLVRAVAEHVSHYRDHFRIHNIACWHNAAMACAGYFLGDPDLVRRATEGQYGFKQQVAKGILEDGMWYERSLGYHGYTTRALSRQAIAAMHNGDDLYELGRFRDMLTLPLRLAFPDLSAPSFNDMGYNTKPIGTQNLELATAWYGDETAESALVKLVHEGASRANETAWQWGEALPKVAEFRLPPSTNLTGTGVAVLRSGKGEDALCAMMEYGEHGGGHGHPDKLQLIFYGLREQLLPDMGTVGYSNPMHMGWFKTTPSHNTVTIGGRNMGRAAGKCDGFEANDRYAAVTASADKSYGGWQLTRRVLLVDRFLVDDFIVKGPAAETIDWFTRAPGDLAVSVSLAPTKEKPLSRPYTFLKNIETGKADDDWTATWRLAKGDDAPCLVLTMRGAPGTIVTQATAPAPKGQRWNNLRVRRRMDATRFTCVYQTVEKGGEVAPVEFGDGVVKVGGNEIAVPTETKALLSMP